MPHLAYTRSGPITYLTYGAFPNLINNLGTSYGTQVSLIPQIPPTAPIPGLAAIYGCNCGYAPV
jgi:hypothetical protein